MSNANGNLTDLNKGSQQAFRALVNSLVPETNNLGDNLPPDVAEKLKDKINELIGDSGQQGSEHQHNDRGELINEEGLPIIEISEPASNDNSHESESAAFTEDDTLIPLSNFSQSAKSRLKQQRDRVLDMLEEEEIAENARHEQKLAMELEETLQKRREAAADAKEREKAAKELQTRMGKALLRSFEKEKEQKPATNETEEKKEAPLKGKSVTFADSPEITKSEKKPGDVAVDWGDVTPARLRSPNKPTLVAQTQSEKQPMKMKVVERVPVRKNATAPLTSIPNNDFDSDDESNPSPSRSSDGSRESSQDSENEVEEDEYDFDLAQHQRDIALKYYQKRSEIGQEAAAAIMSQSRDDYVQDTSLDLPINDASKPAISKFKAGRIASAYNMSLPSTSNQSPIIPASSAKTIQRSIRIGELDAQNRLVGGEDDSASEEELEGLHEVMNLLKRGSLYNIGPDGNYIHTIPPQPDHPSNTTTGKSRVDKQEHYRSFSPLNRPQTSKFKASRNRSTQNPDSPAPQSANLTPGGNPISQSPHISSKSSIENTVTERNKPVTSQQSGGHGSRLHTAASNNAENPQPDNTTISSRDPIIITSPSYSPASTSRRLERPPAIMSSIVQESNRSSPSPQNNDRGPVNKTRISRFLSERQ